jgi:hypothetical protein
MNNNSGNIAVTNKLESDCLFKISPFLDLLYKMKETIVGYRCRKSRNTSFRNDCQSPLM